MMNMTDPIADMLTRIRNGLGAGKDTVVNKLKEINNNIWVSISCTSRLPRKNEEITTYWCYCKNT